MIYKNFYYSFPTKYVFGDKAIQQLDILLKEWNAERVAVFHGSTAQKLGICGAVKRSLESLGCIALWIGNCPQNPDTTFLAEHAKVLRDFAPNFFLAIGGGSVIDAAKGMVDYLGDYSISIGAISTSFIHLKDLAINKKVGKADGRLVPKFALCDPAYTMSLSRYQISCALADIMSHLLEQYFCAEDFGLIDRLSLACIEQLTEIESILAEDLCSMPARQDLVISASFVLSYALSCGRTLDWVPYTIEHCLSGIYNSNHGEGLSIIMPKWVKYSAGNPHYKKRLEALGRRFGTGEDTINDGIRFIAHFFKRLDLAPSLEKMIGHPVDLEKLAQLATQDGPIGRVNSIEYESCLDMLLLEP
jgi:alcohol dehydrogenase YqhD (iron-dependent ADH family)